MVSYAQGSSALGEEDGSHFKIAKMMLILWGHTPTEEG